VGAEIKFREFLARCWGDVLLSVVMKCIRASFFVVLGMLFVLQGCHTRVRTAPHWHEQATIGRIVGVDGDNTFAVIELTPGTVVRPGSILSVRRDGRERARLRATGQRGGNRIIADVVSAKPTVNELVVQIVEGSPAAAGGQLTRPVPQADPRPAAERAVDEDAGGFLFGADPMDDASPFGADPMDDASPFGADPVDDASPFGADPVEEEEAAAVPAAPSASPFDF